MPKVIYDEITKTFGDKIEFIFIHQKQQSKVAIRKMVIMNTSQLLKNIQFTLILEQILVKVYNTSAPYFDGH